MRQPRHIIIANDNAPVRETLVRKSFRQAHGAPTRKPVNPIKARQIKTNSFWIIPALALSFGIYAFWQNVAIAALFWPSVLIGVLLLLTAARAEPDSRLRNVSGLFTVAAAVTGFAAFLAQNGFTLIGVELALLVSALALLFGWIFKSVPSILLSTFSGLIYLASAYPELGLTTGLTDGVSQLGAGLMPCIILGQILLAQKLKSSLVLFTAILTGYIWLGTLAKDMPLTALAGLSFAIAASHYGIGKAWADSEKFGAGIHRIMAWVIAMGAALYIQGIWLNTSAVQAKPFWPPSELWLVILGVSMFVLFVSSLMRYKTSHISLLGIFIITLAVILLPLATTKPDLVYLAFDTVPGLNARPGLGLIIGAAITASGFIWLVGGLKNGRLLDMSIGALAIGIEATVLFQLARFDADLGVVFVVSLIFALCTGGLIAGASRNDRPPVGNYA